MANVFLDLGTHYGQGLEEIIKKHNIDNSWIVHTFEANPTTYNRYKEINYSVYPFVISHNAAVYNYDGTVIINLEAPPGEDQTGQGSSIIDLDKWNPWREEPGKNFTGKIEVPCLDFARFVSNNFKKDDYIIIKMDIEGSEFAIINKLIDTKVIEYIDELYIEWHDQYFTNEQEMLKEKKLLLDSLGMYKVKLNDWK
jgi:FkbM family methyltransferase